MRKNLIQKLTAVIMAATIGNLIGTVGVLAWGPERPTFTMASPASYPTFNSITDNPTIGDERDFVRVGEINAAVTDLKNTVEVIPGKQYLVYIYFHNNASATYNDSAHKNVGVALNTKLSSSFSKVITPSEQGTITATITAKNSNPTAVWDEAYMATSEPKVLLRYVDGSAKIYNDWKANGSIMPSSLFTEAGTYVGLNELNGVVPGCEEYHGVVSYVLQAEELNGTIEKTVSKDGANYSATVDAKPGDELYYRLVVQNAGDVALTNAVVRDSLPSGVSLISGSVEYSANASTTKEALSDGLVETGLNFGTIGTGNTLYITYRARVNNDIDCGSLTAVNVAQLTYDSDTASGDTDSSIATVNITKDDCAAPEDCTTNPNLPGCNTPKEDCTTNPNLPECNRIPDTGPAEIVMAVVIALGIAAGGFYFWRTRRTLRTVETAVSGKSNTKPDVKSDTKSKTDTTESQNNKDANNKL